MKNLIKIIAFLIIVLTLVGCGATPSQESNNKENDSTENNEIKVEPKSYAVGETITTDSAFWCFNKSVVIFPIRIDKREFIYPSL